MRKGTPSIGFGARGLHFVHLGKDKPLLALLYGSDDKLLAKLVERPATPQIQPQADLFSLTPDALEVWRTLLIEILPDGSRNVVNNNPKALAANRASWIAFLDQWISKHEK